MQPKLDTNEFLSPILMSADSFTLPIDGSFAQPLATQLLNPNRTAMLVDEFRIAANPSSQNANGITLDNEFAQIMLDIKMGAIPLTNGETPVRAFMPTYTRQKTTSVPFNSDKQLTWHLPRPMYVPPNVQIHAKIRRRLPTGWTINDANIPFVFSLAGRSVPSGMQVPNKIYVPWATAFHVYNATTVPVSSNNASIVNPHDEPLHMSYLCGFQMNSPQGDVVMKAGTTVQATFSNNKLLIRDPTPFGALFPPNRPVMRLDGLLQPKQFVQLLLDIPTTAANYTNLIFTTIGLVGYREIDTPQGARP